MLLMAVLAVCVMWPRRRRRKRFVERALVLYERMAVEVADLMIVGGGHVAGMVGIAPLSSADVEVRIFPSVAISN